MSYCTVCGERLAPGIDLVCDTTCLFARASLEREVEAFWSGVRAHEAGCAAERVGLLDRIAALRESLAAIVRCLEEAGDIREEHGDAYEAAKSAIARADNAADAARDEMQRLIAKASEVPGMSATIDELRKKATVLP